MNQIVFITKCMKRMTLLTIMMIELYQTEEAHANHTQTEHFATLGMALAPFLDGAPEITVHKSVN